jgi:hypothetical protein
VSKQELKQLQTLIRKELQDNQSYSLQDLLDVTLAKDSSLYESQVKSALLGLVRRNEIDLTDDRVQLSSQLVTA